MREENRELRADSGHAVLLYDARNPAFQEGGAGWDAYEAVKEGLEAGHKGLLQECNWQEITARLRAGAEMSWLADALNEKYEF